MRSREKCGCLIDGLHLLIFVETHRLGDGVCLRGQEVFDLRCLLLLGLLRQVFDAFLNLWLLLLWLVVAVEFSIEFV